MEKKHILAVCAHPDILKTIARLIGNNPEWDCITAPGYEEAIAIFDSTYIDMVLLGSGIAPADEEKLADICANQSPVVNIVQHYGGGSGLLYAEIYGGLQQR
jgi:hypothetical protein